MDRVAWLEAMLEGAEEGLIAVAAGGAIVAANARAGRLLADQRESVPRAVAADAVASGRTVSVLHVAADGARLLVTARPVRGGRGPAGVVVTVQDVSELGRAMRSEDGARRQADRERQARRAAEARERHTEAVVGDAPVMRAARELATRYAALDSPVLLLGETGTGKGVFARLIHAASTRAAGPFVALNCGAIPESMLEAELFGYARGAFTGADARGKAGLIETAHGGTLLLDEIGDLPVALQIKLLRFLDDGEIWPLGAVRGHRPDVRVLAATHHDLEARIAAGAFRRDLYYRLNVLTLRLPPLRERRDDIPALVGMMLDRLAPRLRRRVTIAQAALAVLTRHDFPGNVRELWNVVERLAVTAEHEVTDAGHVLTPSVSPPAVERARDLRGALGEVEAAILRETLARYGSQSQAAAHLGVSQATIARRAKRYGLTRSPTGIGRGAVLH